MTFAEWAVCANSYLMLKPCRPIIRKQPRKGHLFASACCYRIWHLLTDERSRSCVEMVTLYADKKINEHQLRAAYDAAAVAHAEAFARKGKVGASGEWAAQFAACLDPWFAASRASNFACVAVGDQVLGPGPEKSVQADLLRCIFGPLSFRSVVLDQCWTTPAVANLANKIYNERAFDRMFDLADALERAGCTSEDILAHCRGTEPHVRGCWVVDQLLRKT